MRILIFSFFLALGSCSNFIPDQDAVITIEAKDSYEAWTSANHMVECAGTMVADTTVVYITCKVVDKLNRPVPNSPVLIRGNPFTKSLITDEGGSVKFESIPADEYAIQVGNADKYPCIILTSIKAGTGHIKAYIFHLPK